ncbi:unnamed protein product [Protopolystoma xenopodis]|uniref:Uncharacterized protein n=1 Tax=Protopolystoma xenopodis TaxID=117903 RepID=A0A448X827_9PLAT|nr:unnamed protein product [Protopolystoma xenopodis]
MGLRGGVSFFHQNWTFTSVRCDAQWRDEVESDCRKPSTKAVATNLRPRDHHGPLSHFTGAKSHHLKG